MPAAAYLFGRHLTSLRPIVGQPSEGKEDCLFAAERLDGMTIEGGKFEHCTFSNISFKDCTIADAEFRNCTFLGSYFRQARIKNSKFEGCKFFDCDFTKVDIRTCDIRFYNRFIGCWIPRDILEHNLPQEPNLRHHICANLAREARISGAIRDAEWYQQAAARANEEHLRSAVRHSSQYYREKFRGTLRVSALTQLIMSKARGYLWGYRRSFLVVARNWGIATIVFFPVLYLVGGGSTFEAPDDASWSDAWLASVAVTVPSPTLPDVVLASKYGQIVALIQSASSLLFAGLVVALLFRAVFDRWR